MLGWTAAGLGLAAGGYLVYVAAAWSRYGAPAPPRGDERDELLDRFMPDYEVAERHHVRVAAPPELVLEAAAQADLMRSPVVRAIVRMRERILGAAGGAGRRPQGLLEEMTALGWRVLADVPGREIVAGAVTQPWHADVVFRGLPPDEFIAFDEPGYVKIVWTLRADPIGDESSIFRTETRVLSTDAESRRRFRWYWARFSAGIIVIRQVLMRRLKSDAERQAHRSDP
jgi:hypothetical protein